MFELKDVKPLRPLFPELTDSQIRCVYWFALGFDNSGAATISGISESTVRNTLDAARTRLHIGNKSVLRQIAIARLLSPLMGVLSACNNTVEGEGI